MRLVPLGKSAAGGILVRVFVFGMHARAAIVPHSHMHAPDVNLYLVGFMGTGKTTVGRAFAQRIGFHLLDSDVEIERQQGKTVPEIFAEQGEPTFRALERTFIESGHPTERCVVACGGGLVVQPGMLDLLKSKGVVVCLHASLETVLKRTQGNKNRPLLNVEDPMARIRTLYAAREAIYRNSGTLVLTDGRPLPDIVNHVLRIWKREATDFATRRGPAPAKVTR
jgi:shikimate kinase